MFRRSENASDNGPLCKGYFSVCLYLAKAQLRESRCAMLAKKSQKKTKKRQTPSGAATPDWHESLRKHLLKIANIEGIFVIPAANMIHVFSVFEEMDFIDFKTLMRQE